MYKLVKILLLFAVISQATVQSGKRQLTHSSCTRYEYRYDESARRSRCYSACHCDGARSCSWFGWCQGKSRPNITSSGPVDCRPKTSTVSKTIENGKNWSYDLGEIMPSSCSKRNFKLSWSLPSRMF